MQRLSVQPAFYIAGDQAGPGYNISKGHFVEQNPCVIVLPANCIDMDERILDKQIGGEAEFNRGSMDLLGFGDTGELDARFQDDGEGVVIGESAIGQHGLVDGDAEIGAIAPGVAGDEGVEEQREAVAAEAVDVVDGGEGGGLREAGGEECGEVSGGERVNGEAGGKEESVDSGEATATRPRAAEEAEEGGVKSLAGGDAHNFKSEKDEHVL